MFIPSDHFKKNTIKKCAELRPTLKFIVPSYLVNDLVKLKISKKNIIILETERWYNLNAFKCYFTQTKHDVPNIAVHLDIKGEKLLYATDLGTTNNLAAKNYDIYLIEANYKKEELEQRKKEKEENGDFAIEERIEKTHLSYEECMDFIFKNAKEDSIIELMHQHRKKEEQYEPANE